MMKKYFLLIMFFFAKQSHAQFDILNNYYVNSLESSYQMDYGILLSSFQGNYEKSKELLETRFFKNNPDKALLIKALLTYNTLGKRKAFDLVDAVTANSQETKEFSKLWLSYYVKNFDEFFIRLKDFEKKYPENYEVLKLKFRKAIDYPHNEKIKGYDQKHKALKSIDSLNGLTSVKKEDKIYFSLLKLDFLNNEDFYRTTKDKDIVLSKGKLLSRMLLLWKQDKALFYQPYIKKLIDECRSSDCKEAMLYISDEYYKADTISSTQKVYSILMDKNENTSVSGVERKITEILSKEKKEDQLLKIQALLKVFSLPKEPNIGFLIKGVLKPFRFSNEFKQHYVVAQNKDVLMGKIGTIAEDADFEELKEIMPIESEFKEEYESLKKMSAEDVQLVYGVLLFSAYYAKYLQEERALFHPYDVPTDEEKKDYKKYIAFLEKNPLYCDNSRFRFDLPNLNSEAEVMGFLKESRRLQEKYPGCSALLDNCIVSLAVNRKSVTEKEFQNYYLGYFKLVVDLFKVKLSTDSVEQNNGEYFVTIGGSRFPSSGSYFEDFYLKLSTSTKKEAENYLQKAMEEYPENEDFKYIQNIIDKDKKKNN